MHLLILPCSSSCRMSRSSFVTKDEVSMSWSFTLSQSWVQINASTIVDDRELWYGPSTLPPVLKRGSGLVGDLIEVNQLLCTPLSIVLLKEKNTHPSNWESAVFSCVRMDEWFREKKAPICSNSSDGNYTIYTLMVWAPGHDED